MKKILIISSIAIMGICMYMYMQRNARDNASNGTFAFSMEYEGSVFV